jgi:hypothetical protein
MRTELSIALVAVAGAVVGCRPSDILSVPAPSGVVPGTALESQAGAEGAFAVARSQVFVAMVGGGSSIQASGVLQSSELLTDEFKFSGSLGAFANIDARTTAAIGQFQEGGDIPWQALLGSRSAVLLALPRLLRYEPTSAKSKIGEAYALAGYTELLLAEDYCAGTPLDVIVPGGGIRYEMPLSTDSLFGVAIAHFDSARADANGDPSIEGLAAVGLGRALLGRGQYANAATAVANIPSTFVYNTMLAPTWQDPSNEANLYAWGFTGPYDFVRSYNVADHEGGNGLDFRSAHDPRLQFDSSLAAFGGEPWYLPTKFETNLSLIPLASGIEAKLIEAEAALQIHSPAWLTDLNALRADVPGLAPLTDPGSDSGRVSLLFRERAFWLFGTGTRLGDLRRLIRQYGRDQRVVFPTGTYPNGAIMQPAIPSYGTDVSLTLPTPPSGTTITNPNYRGCLTSTKVP